MMIRYLLLYMHSRATALIADLSSGVASFFLLALAVRSLILSTARFAHSGSPGYEPCARCWNSVRPPQKSMFTSDQPFQLPFGVPAFFMNDLAKSAPPRHLNIHVPLPRNELLLYSDCCVDTYYPDNFGLLVPFS